MIPIVNKFEKLDYSEDQYSNNLNYEINIFGKTSSTKGNFQPTMKYFEVLSNGESTNLGQPNENHNMEKSEKRVIDGPCGRCSLHSGITIKFKSSNSLILKFPQCCEVKLSKKYILNKPPLTKCKYNQYFELPLQYLRECLYLPKKIFFQKMNSRLEQQHKNYFKLNPNEVRVFIKNYFSNDKFTLDFSKFSVFDLLFITVVLYKKKYVAWRSTNVNLTELRRSKTNKRKDHLFKFFIKSLLATLANENHKSNIEIKKSSKMDILSNYCFDKTLNFRMEMKRLFNEKGKFVDFEKEAEGTKKSKREKLSTFTRSLMENKKFSKLVNKENLNEIVLMMFREYKKHRMPMHINSLINKLKATSQSPKQFFKMIKKQVFNQKFKSIWSFSEFKAAKEIFMTYIE